MKFAGLLLMLFLIGRSNMICAQEVEIPEGIVKAIKTDDSSGLRPFITKENVNVCYGDYSLLSHAIRHNAPTCFYFLLQSGADVNKICNDYVPSLMHAAKYGRLEMVKALVSKGANTQYRYTGNKEGVTGMTPLTYAERYKRTDVADYLRGLKE